ncbi:MAG TPA: hypothetical protein VK589_14160 [Chryseolinea sp.]|nr:hypothetical protein [Chryseolinea sp.]
MKSKIKILFALVLCSLHSLAQGNEDVEMADLLRQDGKIYTVVFGLVVILTAMIILLIRVDRKLFRIEQDFKREKKA